MKFHFTTRCDFCGMAYVIGGLKPTNDGGGGGASTAVNYTLQQDALLCVCVCHCYQQTLIKVVKKKERERKKKANYRHFLS